MSNTRSTTEAEGLSQPMNEMVAASGGFGYVIVRVSQVRVGVTLAEVVAFETLVASIGKSP